MFFFFKVWDNYWFYQSKKQGLCDHPQRKGFLKGLQRVEEMCVWKNGGHSRARETPLATLNCYMEMIDSPATTTTSNFFRETDDQNKSCTCNSLVSVPIFFHLIHFYTRTMIEPKDWAKQDQCKGYWDIGKQDKKSGKEILLTDTRRVVMFSAQDHQHFWAWVRAHTY